MRNAAIGGLLLTCAAATRYEAWVIVAVFTGVCLLLRPWRETLAFWCCAMLFPATWMIGNQLEFGDALYSVNQNDVWNMGKEGINDTITPVDRFKRAVFFPWSFSVNVSPIVALMIASGFVWAAMKRRLSRAQLLWAVPFVVMACVFQKKAWDGSLMLHHRFLVTWLVLLLPFVPVALLGARLVRLRWVLLVIGTASVIPLTLLWNKVPFQELSESVPSMAFEDLALAYYREMEIVPRLPDADAENLRMLIDADAQPGDGLLVDFIGWDRSYYLSLHARANTKVVFGARHEAYDGADIATFFSEFPHGYVILARSGRLQDHILGNGVHWAIEDVPVPVAVEFVHAFHGNFLYRYTVDPEVQPPAEGLSRVFPEQADALYFEDLIRKDEAWSNKVRRQAFLKRRSFEEAMRDNVAYMLHMEGRN
jgi:hypothetical protein